MKKKSFFILSIMIILLLGAMFVITEKSSEDTSMKYQKALNYIKEKKYPQAMGVLRDIQDYNNSRMIQEQLLYIMNGSYIGNGIWAVGALTPKGGVQVAYSGEGKPYSDVNSWENIKSISFLGGDSIEGLTEEGKIITTSTITKEELEGSKVTSAYEMSDVVKAVSEWKNVKAFQTYYPQAAGALDKDGFVYVAYPHFEKGVEKLKGWEGIVAIAVERGYVAGLKEDGTVLVNNYNYSGILDTSKWQNIVAISAGVSLVGLKEDGTVLSTGLNRFGEGDLSDWKDIIAISTSSSYTLGLKNDGTVVATGQSSFNAMDVTEWSDIVAIQAGTYFSIGLKSDGTIVLSGDSTYSGAKTPDVSNMIGLYVPTIIIP